VDLPAFKNRPSLTGSVKALTDALGDNTRREVYFLTRELTEVTVDQIATRLKIHPNVARHHLEKLVASGYLKCIIRRCHQVGRPSKVYVLSDNDPLKYLLGVKEDLLALLVKALLPLINQADAERAAEEAGYRYGGLLAKNISPDNTHKSVKTALKLVAYALDSKGFGSEINRDNNTLVNHYCPFEDGENVNPVMCAFEKGLIQGMLGTLCGETVKVKTFSRAKGDENCLATT